MTGDIRNMAFSFGGLPRVLTIKRRESRANRWETALSFSTDSSAASLYARSDNGKTRGKPFGAAPQRVRRRRMLLLLLLSLLLSLLFGAPLGAGTEGDVVSR